MYHMAWFSNTDPSNPNAAKFDVEFDLETTLRAWFSPLVNFVASSTLATWSAGKALFTQTWKDSWAAITSNASSFLNLVWSKILENAYTLTVAAIGVLTFGLLYRKGYINTPSKLGHVAVEVDTPIGGFNAHLGSGYSSQQEQM